MKKYGLMPLIILIVAGSISVSAQNRDNYEMIQQKRVEFLIPRLRLTVEESQKFWALFNEYYEKKHQLSMENRQKYGDHERVLQNPEADYLKVLNGLLNYRMEQEKLFDTYYRKYLQILNPEKVYRLYQAEEEFNKMLLRQLKEPSPGKGMPPDKNPDRNRNF